MIEDEWKLNWEVKNHNVFFVKLWESPLAENPSIKKSKSDNWNKEFIVEEANYNQHSENKPKGKHLNLLFDRIQK